MLEQAQQAAPEATVELWAFDEHRIGLKPILRRVWVFNGQRPTVVVQHRSQWLYVYAFVHPTSGHTHWLLLPSVNTDLFALALQHFAQAVGASQQKQMLLVLDRAGWHTSKTLSVPEGLHLRSCLPVLLSCSLPNTCGPCPMNHWSTVIFTTSMNSKRSKPNVVWSYRTLPI